MKKRMIYYLNYYKELSENLDETTYSHEEKAHLLSELLIQIGFFQHERLIHLMVTLAFAFFTIISIIAGLFIQNILLLLLMLLFLILLIPYVVHYYRLENGVQKLYQYYDIIRHKLR